MGTFSLFLTPQGFDQGLRGKQSGGQDSEEHGVDRQGGEGGCRMEPGE